MSGPTIYITNAASVAAVARGNAKPETVACVGPGPVLSIMRFPREEMGEAAIGRVLSLTPPSRLAAPAIAAKKAADRKPHTPHCQDRMKYGDGLCGCGADDLHMEWRAYEVALYGLWEPGLSRMPPGVLGYGVSTGQETRRGVSSCRRVVDGVAGYPWDGEWWIRAGSVPDGATLICACSREAAAAGRCHRVIAADLLKRAGWSVVLDGRSL